MFLLYINDIVNVSSEVNMILFADDTNVFITGENIDEMIGLLNVELKNIYQWLCVNTLSLNVKKRSLLFLIHTESGYLSLHRYILIRKLSVV